MIELNVQAETERYIVATSGIHPSFSLSTPVYLPFSLPVSFLALPSPPLLPFFPLFLSLVSLTTASYRTIASFSSLHSSLLVSPCIAPLPSCLEPNVSLVSLPSAPLRVVVVVFLSFALSASTRFSFQGVKRPVLIMLLKPATPLTVLLLIAFALLLLSVISTPIVKGIPIASYENIDYGVFGYCKGGECTDIHIGYTSGSCSSLCYPSYSC